MSESTRRTLLQTIAAAALAAPLEPAAAQHVHDTTAAARQAAGGVYKPKALSESEYRTLEVLCELVVPGARQGNAAEFIDTLCSGSARMLGIYTAGLAWINAEMRRRYGAGFAASGPEQQRALLDDIAWRKNASPALNPGIEFFAWARRMTVDAYFTSKAGIAELGFKGNSSMREYHVPAECLEHVRKQGDLL